jgi:hypothetical protein
VLPERRGQARQVLAPQAGQHADYSDRKLVCLFWQIPPSRAKAGSSAGKLSNSRQTLAGIASTFLGPIRLAVQNVLNNIMAYRGDLTALMTERFQLFITP